MKAVMQRVRRAQVEIDGHCQGRIETGLMVLLGLAPEDGLAQGRRLVERVLKYRIFPDQQGRMNESLIDCRGGLLLVPNFTLMADTRRGLRPGFSAAAPPDQARALFSSVTEVAREACHAHGLHFACGEFGADMQVSLTNDGPVTILLEA